MQTCLVNLFDLDPPRNGGMSRLARAVSRLLVRHASRGAVDVIFVVGWRFAAHFPAWVGSNQACVISCRPEAGLTPIFKAMKPDLVVSPLFAMAPMGDPAAYPQAPHVAAVPDALALDRSELFPREEAERRRALYGQLRHAARVVTLSEYSRRRLSHHLGLAAETVVVIPLAGRIPSESGEPATEPAPPRPYVCYPANGWPNKRHDLLMRVMKEVWKARPEVSLVLTGWQPAGHLAILAARHGCAPERILDLGYVSPRRLEAIYREAEAMLFVSEYEGFGMPLLEAMENGCPVICAPVTSIPEVAGDAAIYVASDDPVDWARAFLEMLPRRRAELIDTGAARARSFSWERVATAWEKVLTDCGLDLSGGDRGAAAHASLPLRVVAEELGLWSRCYAAQQEELEAKEISIRTLDEHARALAARNAALTERCRLLEGETPGLAQRARRLLSKVFPAARTAR